jgi:LysR family hydrogen peroxide-inducible transcriptional activator
MVASGVGITVLPASSVPAKLPRDSVLVHVPFTRPVPEHRVALAYRKLFSRRAAVEAVARD